ncbi:uncharacterized protein LOC127700632 [Mytilus californianus]|uniref:uncharacterized protein LOC127700632 n=1 Tax=Mytilus californianus TaxID=6549 RepID=UPI0022473A0E|nr:uncharacterized protein LOC127700632 [Mytilus californianus]
MDFGKRGRTYRLRCLYFTVAILLIMIVIIPLYEYIDFWFDSIHSCEYSSKDKLNPPIIKVITQTNQSEKINILDEAKKTSPRIPKQKLTTQSDEDITDAVILHADDDRQLA